MEPCSVIEWPAADVVHENRHWPIVWKNMGGAGKPYTRGWKCPGYGGTVDCSYEKLAEVAPPLCSECDEETTLLWATRGRIFTRGHPNTLLEDSRSLSSSPTA
ncbi:MAG: hypothetical protein NTV86_00815 [Planctomycetota bacterium]|nr:hypothetical protein [Planctomycetota bacterium]